MTDDDRRTVSDWEGAGVRWRKSRFSQTDDCVEVGAAPGVVFVRDTKDREGGTLAFSADTFKAFLGTLPRP